MVKHVAALVAAGLKQHEVRHYAVVLQCGCVLV